jgi:aminocarboxymuconate-semialdehyde decarboxylase
MDAAGIDVQVLAPLPSLFFYWGDPGFSAEIAALTNESIAAMAREHDRFRALGQLPLQSTERTLAELDHVRELGLPGVEIGGNVVDRELDDESLEPVWARLDELELAVFVHPLNPALLPRMEPFHLTNLIGNPLDTTIALSRLILGGVLQRYPRIRFLFAHAGGFVPYLYGRIDHAWHAREDTRSKLDVLPSSFLSTVWFDTIAHAEPPLRYLIDSMGDDRVVVGTDHPADMSDQAFGAKLDVLALSPETRARIEHENALAFLGG